MSKRVWKRLVHKSFEDESGESGDEEAFGRDGEHENFDHLTDYGREAELARRYEEEIRQRQREELLRDISLRYGSDPPGGEHDLDVVTEPAVHDSSQDLTLQPLTALGTGERKLNHGVWMSRRLEKTLASLSRSLLETIYVGPSKIKAMEEHPRVAWYLQHCIVGVDKKVFDSLQGSSRETSCTFARIISLQRNPPESKHELFDLVVMPFDNLSTFRISVSDTLEKPMTDADIEEIHHSMRLSFQQLGDFIFKFPTIVKETSKKLAEFTYTESDVVEILKRKKLESPTLPTAPSITYRELYREREELKTRLDHLKIQWENPTLSLEQRADLERQLYHVNEQAENAQKQIDCLEIQNPSMESKLSHFRRSRINEDSDLFIFGGNSCKKMSEKRLSRGFEPGPFTSMTDSTTTDSYFNVHNSPSSPFFGYNPFHAKTDPLSFIRSIITFLTKSSTSPTGSCTVPHSYSFSCPFWDNTESFFSMDQEETVLLAVLHTLREELSSFNFQATPELKYRNDNHTIHLTPSHSASLDVPILDLDAYFEKYNQRTC